MQWNPEILNKFIAPDISEFTDADIPSLLEDFPQSAHWMGNHFLNNVLRGAFEDQMRQVVLSLIWQVQQSFAAYHQASDKTQIYLDGNDPHNPKIQQYFDALSDWENFILRTQMAIDLVKHINLGENIFSKNDGSKEQRIYSIANYIKHMASCVKSDQVKEFHTVPMWLNNEGINSLEGISVSYAESAELLRDCAKLANELHDPISLNKLSEEKG